MGTFRAAIAIAAKDIRQRSRDRSAYIMGIVGPLVLVFILDATLGAAGDSTVFDLGFADEDRSELSTGLAAVLDQIEADGVITLQHSDDRVALDQSVADGDVSAGLAVAPGFGATVEALQPAEITIVGDPGSNLTVDVAEAIATGFAREIEYRTLALTAANAEGASGPELGAVAAAADETAVPITLMPVEAEGRGFDAASYYAGSLSVFFLFFTVQFGVLSLIEERETGTLDRLIAAPVRPAAVLAGKLASSLIIGLVTMAVLIVSTGFLVGAVWGEPVAVIALTLAGVAVAIGVAMVVGAVARTAEQAGGFASIAALVLGLMGGAFFPINQAPGVLQTISLLSPHRHLLDGFRAVSHGDGLADLGPTFTALAAFLVVTVTIGTVGARRGLIR